MLGWICLWGPGHISRSISVPTEGEGAQLLWGDPSIRQAADILPPTLCKGLGGSWQRPDSELNPQCFLQKERLALQSGATRWQLALD